VAHKNKLSNNLPHHLYEIRDKSDDDVFKYGISSEPLGADGLSKRIRQQLRLLNLVDNWKRFFANILLKNIPGRKKAKEIERKYIREYEEKHGQKPRGNLDE